VLTPFPGKCPVRSVDGRRGHQRVRATRPGHAAPHERAWIRTLLRSLAAQGRTVLVSSHLISEMAHTADALIVIGQGRLLAQTTVAQLSARATSLEEAFFQLTDGVTDYSGRL
jgi:ABC-type transporter Mla maintaining outer membrane lipid asymmetry ATPase subunit MlaF